MGIDKSKSRAENDFQDALRVVATEGGSQDLLEAHIRKLAEICCLLSITI